EAAARVLHEREPVDGARHARMLAQSAGGKGGEDGTCAVDVVRTPTTEPGAVALLLAQQPLEASTASMYIRTKIGSVYVRHRLEHVRGYVGARRVGHGAEVAERQPRDDAARVVDVERSPTAVRRLHAEHPRDSAFALGGAETEAPQREHDHRGVVDVRV